MRLVAAIALIDQAVITLQGGTHTKPILLDVLSLGLALLLLAGLWTPIAGVIATVVEVWSAFAEPGAIWTHILLGTLGAALALLGPGAWSVDAHFFGWKRIDLRDRNS